MSKEVDTYKIFRELEAREKRANPYKFYDKDELIEEILKNEDEIERLNKDRNKLYENGLNDFLELQKKREENEILNNIIKEVREKIENTKINCDGVAEDLIDDIYEILDKGE